MTVCKTLATATKNGYTITAYEVYEKFAQVNHHIERRISPVG